MSELTALLSDVRQCKLCEPELPLGANPIIQASESARLLIIGQAPGTKVHHSSIPWNDPSGDRLRKWLNMSSRRHLLPSAAPLRTVRATFTAYGS
ncbi:uracil-DNA glycosylase family protein, partial [Vibrio penaeicida]|uniref:uracil-DNA glycosylase family protein n=1 Tax=Vibrio penaeicida TaxID=104609 RepID=UPI002755C105|nr:uracil-DNA glycosylase family protein [Vibrio penaeicida]